jgi:4-alpha-glucanotransferase
MAHEFEQMTDIQLNPPRLSRGCGILLHPTSLPGRFGIGDLGPCSSRWLETLAVARQGWWQMLPLGPIGAGSSPYQSTSSFAGNTLLISPERLVETGDLTRRDLARPPQVPADRVDYAAVRAHQDRLLRRAFARFDPRDPDYLRFIAERRWWLDDFALFQAAHEVLGGLPWTEWPADLAARRPSALRRWRLDLADEVRFQQFAQYAFERQWRRLRAEAHARGIRLIGDVPIFVSLDSADVWARPDLFELDSRGRPTAVAGVPPDYFAAEGQLWGNPLYRWPAHADEGYAWWIARLRTALERVDLVRLDHFRGFEAYWSVPAGAANAVGGRWRAGPRDAFLRAVRDALGGLPIIAEDLGAITPEVIALRDRFGLPGMRVLQFAFGSDAHNVHLPHNYIANCVAYTGTHDNNTTVGWYRGDDLDGVAQAPAARRAEWAHARRYLGRPIGAIHTEMIRLLYASVADLAIIPLQDILGLGGAARMNRPGHPDGNWAWRCRAELLDDPAPFRALAEMAETYGRSAKIRGSEYKSIEYNQ